MILPHELDHVGIAVHELEPAIKEYKEKFGFELEVIETLEERKVSLAFLTLGNTSLELLAPTAKDGAVAKFLDSKGPGIHHVCYKVKNIRAELARLKTMGCELLDESPRPGARGAIIAFIHPKSTGGVLTELCEYPNS